MLNPTQLSAAPIRLLHSSFQEVVVTIRPAATAAPEYSIEESRTCVFNELDRVWTLALQIAIGGERTGAPHDCRVLILGLFQTDPTFNGDARKLVEINGASILYGSCREMIASITARTAAGTLLLPSVTFQAIASPELQHPTAEPPSQPAKTVGRATRNKRTG